MEAPILQRCVANAEEALKKIINNNKNDAKFLQQTKEANKKTSITQKPVKFGKISKRNSLR